MSDIISLGLWIKRRRKALDLTQDALAALVGCSLALIQKIEADARRPSREIAALLADTLELAADERVLFIQVARAELSADRLAPPAQSIARGAFVPAQAISSAADTPGQRRTTRSTNLPAPPTPLIGRETELAQIAARLDQRDCRLLTLVGPGGVGKTRLALQAAIELSASFPDGVCFVPLAALNSAELLVPAIAGALGFTFHGRADPKAQLLTYLREKDLLLVLDNFEQLLAGADVLSDLIQVAPGVVLLATSREPLHLRVEWLLDIPGLLVPARADDSGVEQSSAVRLFVQTANRMQADFTLSPATIPSVVRICQFVAGMPLAIELAAAWVRSRSCSEIARELEQSLESLATTMHDVPARHRSMRAVFDHSWRLLSDAEQGVLRRLSVFRGGMQADAAARVAGATPLLLAALVDKSLLRHNGAGRYQLHELVQRYAGVVLHKLIPPGTLHTVVPPGT
jgi:predicted ATPase/transcriptional regulator with XRE-family HTH domain